LWVHVEHQDRDQQVVGQPQDDAAILLSAILLSAFLASVGTPPPSASQAATSRLSGAELHQLLRRLGADS
jgi:hypothetical protein